MNDFNIKNVSESFLGTVYSKVINFSQETDSIYKFDYSSNIEIKSKDNVNNTFIRDLMRKYGE